MMKIIERRKKKVEIYRLHVLFEILYYWQNIWKPRLHCTTFKWSNKDKLFHLYNFQVIVTYFKWIFYEKGFQLWKKYIFDGRIRKFIVKQIMVALYTNIFCLFHFILCRVADVMTRFWRVRKRDSLEYTRLLLGQVPQINRFSNRSVETFQSTVSKL